MLNELKTDPRTGVQARQTSHALNMRAVRLYVGTSTSAFTRVGPPLTARADAECPCTGVCGGSLARLRALGRAIHCPPDHGIVHTFGQACARPRFSRLVYK